MPWFKVDDGLAFHTKSLAAGNAAMGLWVRAGSWSSQQLTDGFVPTPIARQLGTRGEARRLVEAGLWIEKDDGYLFHEFEQRNPTRVQVLAEREANRLRQEKGRARAKVKREARKP